jgi:hypothetical protein
LRPVVAALILSASFELFKISLFKISENVKLNITNIYQIFNIPNIIVFAVVFAGIKIFKLHPVVYVIFGGVCGALLNGFIS